MRHSDLAPQYKEEAKYQLPNKSTVVLPAELRCDVTESIFNEYLTSHALPPMIAHAIRQCAPGLRDQLWSNIVLTGGNTRFHGFDKRLAEELSLLERKARIQVRYMLDPQSPRFKDTAFIGAAKFASLSHCRNG